MLINPIERSPVAVVGARGKTGRAIVSSLQSRGIPVVAIGRAEMQNSAEALRGCRAAYLMAPNLHPDERNFIFSLIDSCHKAEVSRIVYHSVAAPYAPGMMHHVAKAAAEDVIRRSGLEWSILQPCAYIENLMMGLQDENPHIDVAYSIDTLFGLISVADVGDIAAAVLLNDSHIGATYELGGPEQLTIRDYAERAEQVLGRKVVVNQSTPNQWSAAQRSATQAAGQAVDSDASGSYLDMREIEWLEAMFSYYDAHGLPCGPFPAQNILGRVSRSVEEILRAALSSSSDLE